MASDVVKPSGTATLGGGGSCVCVGCGISTLVLTGVTGTVGIGSTERFVRGPSGGVGSST